MINYEDIGTIHVSKDGTIIKEVRDKVSGKHYALKIVGPIEDSFKNIIFNREVTALKKLNKYENIVKIYDSTIAYRQKLNKNYGLILLELIYGKSMDKISATEYTDIEKYKISLDIIEAVKDAHSNSIIHRDIKPSNIMLDGVKAKVIDFGISKIKSAIDEGTVRDMKSKEYCAPEASLRGDFSELSDIYSVGAVIYNLFTGEIPPQPNIFEAKIHSTSLRSDLKEILCYMVKENKEERLSDFSEAKKAILKIISDLNFSRERFIFTIDIGKFDQLKREGLIRRSTSYNEFLKSILPNSFAETYGFYTEEENKIYEFFGEDYIIKCFYEHKAFEIFEIRPLDLDKKVRFKKKFLKIDGNKIFESKVQNVSGINSNHKLVIELQNHLDEYNSKANKDKKFNDYFKDWKEYLNKCIESEKEKSGYFKYTEYKFHEGKIKFAVDSYTNNELDSLDENVYYVLEKKEKDKEIPIVVGCFENLTYENNCLFITIRLTNKSQIGAIKDLLSKGNIIKEDYGNKISQYKKQFRAINSLEAEDYQSRNLKDILLDLEEPACHPHIVEPKLHFDKMNESQKDAVKKALNSETLCLVQGPPGTGKTKVITEIIYQILRNENYSYLKPRILVVSQSHTAVDNILDGIKSILQDVKILRIGPKAKISEDIYNRYSLDSLNRNLQSSIVEKCNQYIEEQVRMCKIKEEDLEVLEKIVDPHIERLAQIYKVQKEWLQRIKGVDEIEYQIVLNSCIIAGTCVGFTSNEAIRDMVFDYVIIDEAAKATTPELLISIIKANKIILVGDQNQLPPFLNSDLCKKMTTELIKKLKKGLFGSLYEILPNTHKVILATQYRMHPTIGNLISSVFYNNEIATGVTAEERVHNVERFRKYAIVWLNTSKCGPGRCEEKPPAGSYENLLEAQIIKRLLKDIDSSVGGKDTNIGIITGYFAQKELIKKEIKNCNFDNISRYMDINTVDAFQGKENDIIIYSTVRSSDLHNDIGFLKEKERINVAFSRAKCLLIIVGDLEFFNNWDIEGNKFTFINEYLVNHYETCRIIDCSKEVEE